ncbi:MAG: response regulator transcription factor [Candidatus Binataceae bacterium]
MNEKVTVAVIDDDDSIRRSLTRLLASTEYEVHAFASAEEFLSSRESVIVSCVVSDLRMPGVDGLHFQKTLREKLPHLSIVFITGHGDVSATVAAMKAGAVDFLEKPVKGEVLIDAIQRAAERSHKLKSINTEIDQLKIRYEALTRREREVFALVSAGLLNKQTAAELGAAEKTIKQHRGQVMAKMKAASLADLVLMAERLGIRPAEADFAKARGRIPSA